MQVPQPAGTNAPRVFMLSSVDVILDILNEANVALAPLCGTTTYDACSSAGTTGRHLQSAVPTQQSAVCGKPVSAGVVTAVNASTCPMLGIP
jgi:hypothetical protein